MNSSGDLPILRYKSCFMASCNTGRTFSESFTHGTFLYSMDDTNGLIGKNGKIEGDLYTERNNWEIVEGKLEHSLVPLILLFKAQHLPIALLNCLVSIERTEG